MAIKCHYYEKYVLKENVFGKVIILLSHIKELETILQSAKFIILN